MDYQRINVAEYGILPEDGREVTWKLRELLKKYRGEENICLFFPEGTYHFYQDYAEEILLFIPNQDEDTIKRVAFPLRGCKNWKIQGEHAAFVFHTDVLPFLIQDCQNVEVEGISVDYARPGYSQGIIRKAEPHRMEIEVDEKEFPWYIRGDRVYFYGENYCRELERWMELDGRTEAPVPGLIDRTFNLEDAGEEAHYRKIGENLLEVTLGEGELPFESASRPGNYLILRHHPRNCPGFFIEDSKNVRIYQVEIYHTLAMGVVASRGEDIFLEEVQICRHPRKHHVYTAEADGFHFVLCSGKIGIKNCLVENQLDDPVNIHGIYGRVGKIWEDGSFLTELVHHQQKGTELIRAGENFQIVKNDTMLPFANGKAKKVERLNKDYMRIWPEKPVEGLQEGYALENMDQMPQVEIIGCTFRNNRARGILCTTAKPAVIRNNYFHVPGAALLVGGDANFWFESGATGDILFEENVVDQCAYVPAWGKAPLMIDPNVQAVQEGRAHHGKLIVRNNQFRIFDERLLYADHMKEIVWENNRVEKEETFPPVSGEPFVLKHVLAAKIET